MYSLPSGSHTLTAGIVCKSASASLDNKTHVGTNCELTLLLSPYEKRPEEDDSYAMMFMKIRWANERMMTYL